MTVQKETLEQLATALTSDALTDDDLKQIAKVMSSSAGDNCPNIPAGITYLGQFIAHDIVPSTNRKNARKDVSPLLNLDSVYWPDNLKDSYIHQQGCETGQFKMSNDFGPHYQSANLDIPRCANGAPLIPELRNDENTIVSQIHTFWIRLHNALLANSVVKTYQDAKRLTTLCYQSTIFHDFLPMVLNKDIWDLYFCKNQRLFNVWDNSSIPQFFSHAAFRFGHSMVQSAYELKSGSPGRNLRELFRYGKKLDKKFLIDWTKFFSSNGENSAKCIDTAIIDIMENVPFPPVANEKLNPIFLNLLAGYKANLPSGFVYAELLSQIQNNVNVNVIGNLTSTKFFGITLSNNKLLDAKQLPLWPYILLEAEQSKSKGLGKVGSILVAEVLATAIKNSEDSIWSEADGRFQNFRELSSRNHLNDIPQEGSVFLRLLSFINKNEERHDQI